MDGPLSAGEFAARMMARVVTADGGASGQAFTSMESRYHDGVSVQTESEVFDVNYDADYLARRRTDGSEEIRLFDRNEFETFGWRYGLYDPETGNRVERESGFSVRTESGAYGWAGYYGLWLPEEVSLVDGQTVFRDTHGEAEEAAAFTAFVREGKLRKRELLELTLADLTGEDLFYWTESGQSIVRWNGTDLQIVANQNSEGGSGTRFIPADPPVSLSTLIADGEYLQFWSDGRGGVQMQWPTGVDPTDSTAVQVRTETTVLPSDDEFAQGAFQLYGFFNAPRPLATAAQLDYAEGLSPFFDDVNLVQSAITYSMSGSEMVLKQNGESVLAAQGVDMLETQSEWGIYSGPLVPTLPENAADVWEAPVVYEWEYGPREWNQLRALRDSEGEIVTFDRPLAVEYTHDDEADPEFDGRTFRLEYNGFGDLHGLPHRERDDGNWLPLISIPSGSEVTAGEDTYVVKLLEGEQRMVEVVSDSAAIMTSRGLGFDVTLDPPADLFTDPDIGVRPTVTTPPAYVAGEPQS
ncbi:MAG: hypothetical protein AAF196_20045, partial [Planctomycetota bacterium]